MEVESVDDQAVGARVGEMMPILWEKDNEIREGDPVREWFEGHTVVSNRERLCNAVMWFLVGFAVGVLVIWA